MPVPTVKIEHEDGYCVINESDYDEEEHVLYGEEAPSQNEEASSDEPTEDDSENASQDEGGEYTVKTTGGGWYDVVGPDGPIDDKGRRKEDAEAKAAELNAEA